MNTNRQKLVTKSNNNVRSCQKHYKQILESSDKSSKLHTHIPSIKCHEEAVCNRAVTSSCNSVYNNSEPDMVFYNEECNNSKKSKIKEKNKKTGKYPSTKSIGLVCSESTRKKIDTKDVDTIQKSKSAPLVHIPNLEDSVDFIPVKLSNKIDGFKKRHQKYDHKSVISEKSNTTQGPTWDQLLKGGSKTFDKIVKNGITANNDKDQQQSTANTNTESKLEHNKEPIYKNKSDEVINKDKQVSDVINTLRLLIENQRELVLKQPQNDNMNKIIMDIDDALLKLHPEEQPRTESEVYSSIKSSTVTTSKSPQSGTKQINISEWDIPLLKKNLEESCLFLQSLCIKQRENCNSHIREKEQLSIQLAESRRLVATAKSKEKDYEKTIGELRLKLQETNSLKEQQSQTLQKLNNEVAILKSTNEALESLNLHLKECATDREILQSKLYLKDLEIEKLKVLLGVKHASNNEKFEEGIVADELKLDIPQDDKATLLSLASESSLNLGKPRIICSSQASSSPRRSPSPYDSWQHISSIPQDLTEINGLHNSMVRLFNIMKTDTEWCDSLELELEEPLLPSFYSEEDEINPKDINLGCGNIESFSS